MTTNMTKKQATTPQRPKGHRIGKSTTILQEMFPQDVPQLDTHIAAQVMSVSALLAVLPYDISARFDDHDLPGLAHAHMAWMLREKSLDPRVRLYSQRATADQLFATVRILRGTFDHLALPGLTLEAALDWLSILLDLADEAEAHHQQPMLPTPYLWRSRTDLDHCEQHDPFACYAAELQHMQQLKPLPKPRRPRKPRQGSPLADQRIEPTETAGHTETPQTGAEQRDVAPRRGRGRQPRDATVLAAMRTGKAK